MKKYLAFTIILCIVAIQLNAQDSLKFSRQQVAIDITFFLKNAEAIHPNLYHGITEQQLRKSTDSLLRSLPDSLSEMATFRAFAEATAFINEGHTGSNIPKYIREQIKLGTFQSIPLQIIDYDNSTFKANLISSGLSLKKIDISSINGQSATSIFRKITALKGGLPSFKKVSAINYFRFYSKIIGLKAPYVINYQSQGKAYKIEVDASTEQDYLKLIDKPKLIEDYSYQVINNSIGCINFKIDV